MIRNLKNLALALLAAVALGALCTSSASAAISHTFTSSSGNGRTILTGTTEPGTKEVFTLTGSAVECEDITYRGTVVGNEVDHVSVVPVFDQQCTTALGNATVDNNGCTYTFDSDTLENTSHFSAGTEHASVSLACGHSGNIAITAPGCTIIIETTHSGGVTVNHNLPGARYTAVPSHSGGKAALTVNSTLRTIKATTEGAQCALAGLGNPETHSTGTYSGRAVITGYEDTEVGTVNPHANNFSEGNLVNLGLTTPPGEPVPHSFTSDSGTGSTVLTGTTEPGTKEVFSLTAVKFECEDVTYRGTVVGNKVDHFSVVPVFDKTCSGGFGGSATLHNNGCTYTYDSDTAENSAHFSVGVEHANVSLACGDAGSIVITAFLGCTITLETTHAGGVVVNHNLPGVRYTQVSNHSGGKAALTVTTTLKTMKATTTGANCVLVGLGNPGTHANMTWSGSFLLTGYEDNEGTTKDPHTNSFSEGALVNLGLTTP